MTTKYEVLGKVNVPEENMKDLIWVDRKSGEIRTTPFQVKRLSEAEKTKRANEKAAKSKAFRARVKANAMKKKNEADARVKQLDGQ